MMNENLVKRSFGWSAIGEISAKLVGPLSTMALARILTPHDFGVIAVCNMVLFLADIFVDAGFSKYLIQYDFKDKEELYKYSSVAFWSNIGIAVSLWLLIVIFRDSVASFMGGKDYGNVIVFSTLQMVIVAMISPQIAILRRNFAYQKLCFFRLVTSAIPLVITVPLALYVKNYWALIFGSFVGYVAQAIFLHLLLRWLPSLTFSFAIVKKMFSFSFWSLCEGLAHWLIFWIDTFILTKHFDSYYVGLYKNSSSFVTSCFLMIASAIVPVLFSVLCRIKGTNGFNRILFSTERLVLYCLLPLSIIIWFNRDLVTTIILGGQWNQASIIVGFWAIIMTVSISIYSFPAEAFKAIGKPKYLFWYQVSYLAFLIPLCWYAADSGFWIFVYTRVACTLIQTILFVLFTKTLLHWKMRTFLSDISKPVAVFIPLIAINVIINIFDSYQNFGCEVALFAGNIIIALLLIFFSRKDIRQHLKLLEFKQVR